MRSSSRLKAHQSKKFVEHKNLSVIFVVVLIIFSFSVWSYCFIQVSNLDFFSINKISVIGFEGGESNIKNEVSRYLNGTYLGFFSKANFLLYPKKQIANALSESSKEIESLLIKRDGLNGLTIDIKKKIPEAVICASLPEFKEDNTQIINQSDCYYVDHNGLIYSKIASSTDIDNLNRYYVPDLSGVDTVSERFSSSTEEFKNLQKFYNKVRSSDLLPLAILIKDGGEYEMYLPHTIVYFTNKTSLETQLKNLVSFWEFQLKRTDKVIDLSKIEYLDIRYGSNVFYRQSLYDDNQ